MVVRWCNADMVDVLTKSVGIFHILLLTSCIYWTDSQVISPCTDKNDGDPCLLLCQTPDVNQAIGISQSPAYTNGGTCLGGSCFPADSSFNISQVGTTTTLEILSFGKSDNGTWRCEYGTIGTHSIFISWSKLPTSITELSGLTSNATITADLTISVEVGCLYSLQDPTVKLQLMCDGALATSYDMSSSPSTIVCSDSDLSAYICNYTMTSNPPSQTCNSGYTGYSLKAVVSLDGTTKTFEKDLFESSRVSFESKTTTTTSTPTIPTSTETPQEKCFGTSVPFSNNICITIYVFIGVLLLLAFIICVVIYRKKNQSKENKYAEGPQRSENPSVAVPLKRTQNKSDSDQVIEAQQSANELNAIYTERKNIKLPKQDKNGLENSKNEQMTDPHALNNTEQRPPNDNYQYNWNRV